MRRLVAALLLALWPTQALADPVSLTVSVLGISAWWASIGIVGQTLIYIGVGLALAGVSYLLSGSGQRADAAARDNLISINVPERDGLLERCRLYGIDTTPGGVFFQKTADNGVTSNPSVYVFGVVISEGECDGLESVVINGVECELDSAGDPVTAPWNDGAGVKYFEISFRPGTTTQAIDPLIASYFPSENSEFRQRGVCTVVMALKFGLNADHHTELWGASGIPQLLFRVRGLLVYNPRDANQSATDATTWTWSDNAALCEADWLTCAMGFDVDPAEINWPSVITSAATDDESVTTLAGSERRGRINGRAYATEANADVLESMGQQNRALVRRADGLYSITADRANDPVATLHEGLLVGDIGLQNEPDTRAALNILDAEFRPASKFNQSDETSYADVGLIAADGEEFRQRISLRFCDSPAAAQRLAYALVKENRVGRTLTLTLDVAALYAAGKGNKTLEMGDVVRVDFGYYPAMNGLYTVRKLEITSQFQVFVSLSGYDPAHISGWSAALETEYV